MHTQPKTITIPAVQFRIPAVVVSLYNAPFWVFGHFRRFAAFILKTLGELTDTSAAGFVGRERRKMAVNPSWLAMRKREAVLKAIRQELPTAKGREKEALFFGLTTYEKEAVLLPKEKFFLYLVKAWQHEGFDTEDMRLLEEMEHGTQKTTVKADGHGNVVSETTVSVGAHVTPNRDVRQNSNAVEVAIDWDN